MKTSSDRAHIVRLALRLDRGGVVEAAKFAREVGVTQRTVERWLNDVERVIPLDIRREAMFKQGQRVEYRKAVL